MSAVTVIEIDCTTGELRERPATATEQQQANADAAVAATAAAAPPPPDPDDELAAAISAATTLSQLKDALIGKGRPSAVRGRPTDSA